MSQTQKISQILKWFEKEKVKDDLEIKSSKNKIIQEIKGLKKDDLFTPKQKTKNLTLWQRIRKMIWGN